MLDSLIIDLVTVRVKDSELYFILIFFSIFFSIYFSILDLGLGVSVIVTNLSQICHSHMII